MNQQESSLNERILEIFEYKLRRYCDTICGDRKASEAIEKLIIQEKIDLLTDILATEGTSYETIFFVAIKSRKTELQNQLKQL